MDGLDIECKKMKETKHVTQGFGALLIIGRMKFILIEIKKLSLGHLNLKHYWISKWIGQVDNRDSEVRQGGRKLHNNFIFIKSKGYHF